MSTRTDAGHRLDLGRTRRGDRHQIARRRIDVADTAVSPDPTAHDVHGGLAADGNIG
ncbi:hypothetical protein QM806_26600 [Rhodococcus sp. IEGM 1351]|uniref:hypothetical protein n=1 Tax=Rhodococcus TaxID=1827 RepID=UPI0013E056B2|nr:MULTISPECIES: hypothetical protein [Rhodococcus]MDI9938962.1 hypothetical protein [Rhodococcus sp. IEGM 1351]